MEDGKTKELKETLLKGVISSVIVAIILSISHLPYLPTLLLYKIGFIYRFVDQITSYNYYAIMLWYLLFNSFVGVLLGIAIGLFCYLAKLKLKNFNALILIGFIVGLIFGGWDSSYLMFCGNSTFQEILDCKITHIIGYGVSFGIYAMVLGSAFKK